MNPEYVDLRFPMNWDAPLSSVTLSVDSGYAMFSVVSALAPTIHSNPAFGIHPIHGKLIGARHLRPTEQTELVVRLAVSNIPQVLPLVHKRFSIEGASGAFGAPTVQPLIPASALIARLVTIKNALTPDSFLEGCRKSLARLEIRGSPHLLPRQHPSALEGGAGGSERWVRRTLRVGARIVVGYALAVTELDADESIRLQVSGIGGRRRFGCGVFVPWRK